MKKFALTIGLAAMSLALSAQKVAYDIPTTLSYYGTIQAQDGVPFPAANYVTTNPINDGAFIWVPVGSKVFYHNTSDNGASAYKWLAPGASAADDSAENLIATYNEAGTFDFPTLTATYSAGDITFHHDLKIKVGGKAELCHSDTRQWAATYGLGYAPFMPQGNGALGGSNKLNIAGVGNFYRFSSPDMYVDGLNIYTHHKPENFADDASVKVRVYLPYIGESSFLMIGTTGTLGALEADNIPMANCKVADDGVYVPVKGFGVYNMSIASPMNCEGLPYLFFAVEGFASDPEVATLDEDFVIATDVMPNRSLELEDYVNALAHNSFARLANEVDYSRPVTIFGGTSGKLDSYNFWICPLVRGAETPFSGIEDISSDKNNPTLTLKLDGEMLHVSTDSDCAVEIYSLNGSKLLSGQSANGGVIFNISHLAHGVYIVKSANGAGTKFVK